ncbi:hypothetical protein RclHR1_08330005 [Rhizophagus clarus]|uniref:P-loop containing nucleoside triphosphate hydrolase protein n=1 Tax=Rhizophagus clarus TaxID=94130 RepID=A0A2Z6SFM3_9GLOM|nr:hypothetical protein RclHR1_08330005 [Rhizophagus clarus]GES72740.1 P-loop containing nucleoside triphosphate hydrolase protein [Rhizophagus clarus]
MSSVSAYHIQGNSSICNNIPYEKYFEFFPHEKWSLPHYDILIIDNYEHAEKDKTHHAFYNALFKISNDFHASQGIRDVAQKLADNKRADIKQVEVLWKKAKRAPPTLPSSSSLSSGKKRDAEDTVDTSSTKKRCVIPEMSFFFPDEDVPLQANGSTIDILEVVKSVVRTFDKNTIAQGSSRSYKSSNHLQVDSKCNIYVPKESVYDAEMYRILHNWLAKVHSFEITGQWHIGKVCDDGIYHHFYCDLTIKKSDDRSPVAVLELLATSSSTTLDEHFERVLNYADKLKPSQVWVIHFSREDNVAKDPYWPCIRLQERGLNVVHFWHDKDFANVRMSARSLDISGKFHEIIDEQIIP